RYWFDRATSAQFDWEDAYTDLIDAWRPRWGGSYELLYAFGLECKKTERYDTDVPYKLISVLCKITADQSEEAVRAGEPRTAETCWVWRMPGVYGNAIDVLEKCMAWHDSHSPPAFFNSMAAGCAWRAGKMNDCRKFLERVDDAP